MSLIAALCIDVGTSIAKSILRIWFKDLDLGLDASSATITDILKEKTSDRVAQHRAQRQKDLSPLEDLPNLKRLELYGISAWVPVSLAMQERIRLSR